MLQPGQPQPPMGAPMMGTSSPMGGVGPQGPMPIAGAMGALFSSMANLAQNMPRTSMDKVREAVKLLEDARDEDPKLDHLSMALGLIINGPDSLEKYGFGSQSDHPKDRRTSE